MKKNARAFACVFFTYVSLFAEGSECFISSFVSSYGFDSGSLYTREYHPYIMHKAREHFLELQRAVAREINEASEHKLILGYQRNAVPSYYMHELAKTLTDEFSKKTNSGWTLQHGNLFGFLTGFAFKDAHVTNVMIEHIYANPIGLFDDRADIFHKHAFGNAYELCITANQMIHKAIKIDDLSCALTVLGDFWHSLYTGNFYDGSKKCIVTQDLLFNIDFLRTIQGGHSNITHMFIGPDITYPITVNALQPTMVTQDAQEFLKHFIPTLKSIDNEPTVYVFSSFVDGVGKSTLLGNIQNWIKYEDNWHLYDAVDNSSSQHAQLFEYKPNVFIADLPAFMSHVEVKPDGYVFVEGGLTMDADMYAQVQTYAVKNMPKMIHQWHLMLKGMSSNDWFIDQYTQNCVMLKREKTFWIPFVYKGYRYLMHQKTKEIKKMISLDSAGSRGLKNHEVEQMIFEQLLMPLSYDAFLNDFINKLKKQKIRKVVYVDFLSMYPRSSRENVRLNFILQQMKKIFKSEASVLNSLYFGMINPQQAYVLLHDYNVYVEQALQKETMVRFSLNQMLQNSTGEKISIGDFQQVLKAEISKLSPCDLEKMNNLINNRIAHETTQIRKKYVLDPVFQSLVLSDVSKIKEFSDVLLDFMVSNLAHGDVKDSWRSLRSTLIPEQETETKLPSGVRMLSSGQLVRVLHRMHVQCKQASVLYPLFRMLRINWYAQLLNCLRWNMHNHQFNVDKESPVIMPIIVLQENDYLLAVAPVAEVSDVQSDELLDCLFDRRKSQERPWGIWADHKCCVAFDAQNTYQDLFAYGFNGAKAEEGSVYNRLMQEWRDTFEDAVMPSHVFFEVLKKQNFQKKEVGKTIKVSGLIDPNHLQWIIHALSTLELIIKDPFSSIMTCNGSQRDFVATAQLIKNITLPTYFDFDAHTFELCNVSPIIACTFDA